MSRKAVEALILKRVSQLTTNKKNHDLYKKRFSQMSDREFKVWADSIVAGDTVVAIYMTNDDTKADMAACHAYCESQGHPIFQKIIIQETNNIPAHMTLVPHMTVMAPIRRQSQTFNKKVSVAKSDKLTDALTGQATGASSPTDISSPENRVLAGTNLRYTARELMKVKGGDEGAYQAYKYRLLSTGAVSQQEIQDYATGTGSLQYTRSWLAGKHIGTNL